jgi:hypothetical protein
MGKFWAIIVALLLLVPNGSGCSNLQQGGSKISEQAPLIKEIRFEDPAGKVISQKDGWYELGAKVKIVVVLAGDCQEVDMLIMPTGTAVYKEQRPLAMAMPENHTAEYVWDVPPYTMGYFQVIAFNGDVGRRSALYNVASGQ